MATANPFELLGEGDDAPEAVVTTVETVVVEKKPAEAVAKAALPIQRDAGSAGGRGERGERGRGRGGRGRGGDRTFGGGEGGEENGYGGDVAYDGAGGGRGGRGRGEGRGRGRGRGGYEGGRPPRREFERHDGTGRGHEDEKRGGAGRGNWGTPIEGEPVEEAADEETPVVEPAEAEAAVEEGAAEEPAPPVVEEVKELSLEEYEQQLAEKKAALNKARAARTIDASELTGLKALERKEEDNPLGLSSMKEKKAPKAKERKEVAKVEAGFRVERDDGGRGYGDRGGRGGRGRDGRGRGSGRGPRGGREGGGFYGGGGGDRGNSYRGGHSNAHGASINMADESAFPSLG